MFSSADDFSAVSFIALQMESLVALRCEFSHCRVLHILRFLGRYIRSFLSLMFVLRLQQQMWRFLTYIMSSYGRFACECLSSVGWSSFPLSDDADCSVVLGDVGVSLHWKECLHKTVFMRQRDSSWRKKFSCTEFKEFCLILRVYWCFSSKLANLMCLVHAFNCFY